MPYRSPENMEVVRTRYHNKECKALVLTALVPGNPETNVNMKVFHNGGETILDNVRYSPTLMDSRWSW